MYATGSGSAVVGNSGNSSSSRSVGNLRLGILPENRAINFQEPFVYNASNGLQIKSYGLIDEKGGNRYGPQGFFLTAFFFNSLMVFNPVK